MSSKGCPGFKDRQQGLDGALWLVPALVIPAGSMSDYSDYEDYTDNYYHE
jgi:hypothetical protein